MHSNNSNPSLPDWLAAGHSYYSLNYFYKQKFGEKIRKISLDAGLDCPNRDGTLGRGGCIFCDPASFSPSRRLNLASLSAQMEEGMRQPLVRSPAQRFIAYFQPATNTYGPLDRLRAHYEEAISHPKIVGLAVGTRPDCVPDEVLDLLAELARRTFVQIEYGLQSSHNRSLRWMNRGHTYETFLDAVRRSRERNLQVGVHLILGLPSETREDMRITARELAKLNLHSLKFHNLYAVKNTRLAEMAHRGEVVLPEMADYISWVVDFLELTPPNVVIDRLCGDAPAEYLLGPPWCVNKSAVKRAVEEEFRRRGTRQGVMNAEC
ncbi:MAG: TIGR01212 family radical SAM protein [Pirellulales bacterium]|nr:TIGR01212 family radical SAM protein [Pirellulales bacterium]